jgi:outer membrane protein assembly factor BamB
MTRTALPALIALLLCATSANALITKATTLEQIVTDQPLIFTAKVVEFLPDKPGMVFAPVDKLRGEFPFDRVPVNLTGDDEAKKGGQTKVLLERLEKDLPFMVFATFRGKTYRALAYTNGTWFGMDGTVEQQDGQSVTRWRFTHGEPYLRRTFKGTTDEMMKAVRGGLKGEKLPVYDDKAEPGYGPPLRKGKPEGKPPVANRPGSRAQEVPFAVIQLPFLGLIAALAALFPAVFGGMALLMRRWVAALSVASAISILTALVMYFPNWVAWTGLKSLSALWLTASGVAALGALWAIARYRRALRDGREEEYQPRYLDRVGLAIILVAVAGGLTYAVLTHASLTDSPWLELLLFAVPVAACLYFVVTHWLRTRTDSKPVAVSAETVGLWAGSFACAVAGAALLAGPRGPAIVADAAGGPKLDEQPLWVFEPKVKGEIIATPCVTPERVYVAVHHRQGFDQYGRVYALDPATGAVLWDFDHEGNLKPLFSSPTFADGRLYFGEGYHTDQDSKLFCLDAVTGKMHWAFETTSHTESTPAIADGKVVFGAGDDGLYCLDAVTGQKLWQYPADGGLHVDSNPLVHGGRVYAGSGISQRSKTTRIFCLDLKTGAEIWTERVEYAAWGSPAAAGSHVLFATGNGTFSEDRAPVAGLVLCRDAATGKPFWERALPNSLVGRPAIDRYQAYVGCRDGNVYALDRHTGDVVWTTNLHAPVLASPAIDIAPKARTGEVVYAIGSTGLLQALSPANGSTYWAVSFRDLIEAPHVSALSTPVVVRQPGHGRPVRHIYVGLGFGPSPSATPSARLYCFRDAAE